MQQLSDKHKAVKSQVTEWRNEMNKLKVALGLVALFVTFVWGGHVAQSQEKGATSTGDLHMVITDQAVRNNT